ncbi:dienelactone hydrolase family protein [Flavicella sp.]|uniref:alpha/beta hydrolase n=1 Tax=Flavicella sp. TaxID=2957742 RepID=UPI0026268220|nr:dienelactone hydrolase family protein [Flavicella sp.]MDG1804246.1 dienelactone hydrolase family protein [Flavicella sp.]MDG2280335.1 dienelactone hydrolase family protein [Flavicella sp.]
MNTNLHFVERAPIVTSDQPAPLLILIHGYGSNEMDLFSFASELPDNLHIVSLRAPLELGYNSFAWYSINFDADQNKFSDLDEARTSLDQISNFIDEFTANHAVDTDKLFVVGFSQGAILSYGLSLNTNKIPYVVALSGYLNEDLIADTSATTTTQYFCSHGSVDQVIPVEWARKAPVYLNDKGISNVFKEYPVGHGVHPQNFYDFKAWIDERL